jgi:hypothetical protein
MEMALRIRPLMHSDLRRIRELHDKYYPQFEFPEVLSCCNAFVIDDENNDIVLAGFIEQVAEAMLVTNKAKSEIKIGKALVEAQRCAIFTCQRFGMRDLYAFVDNDVYAKHLIQHGFENAARALKLRIPNGQSQNNDNEKAPR